MQRPERPEWLLLLFELPAAQSNLRVKIWRRLQKVGALNLKAGVYMLPKNAEAEEDFEWLRQTLADAGAPVTFMTARTSTEAEHEAIVRQFRELRAQEYRGLISRLGKLAAKAKSLAGKNDPDEQGGLFREQHDQQEKLQEILKVDYFPSRLTEEAKRNMESLKRQLHAGLSRSKMAPPEGAVRKHPKAYQGKTWVTRAGMHVDRLASAWLISSFIDRKAKFAFADTRLAKSVLPPRIPFDMGGAEFGHHGEDCTFETLVKAFGLTEDLALVALAEIVHDVDIKDGRFGREEAAGLDWTVRSLRMASKNDKTLLKEGGKLFASLYAGLQSETKGNRDPLPRR